jgi:hypothetical protein
MIDEKGINIPDQSQDSSSHREKYLKQLQGELADPLHIRIVAAYQKKGDPVASMEAELGTILTEILAHED